MLMAICKTVSRPKCCGYSTLYIVISVLMDYSYRSTYIWSCHLLPCHSARDRASSSPQVMPWQSPGVMPLLLLNVFAMSTNHHPQWSKSDLFAGKASAGLISLRRRQCLCLFAKTILIIRNLIWYGTGMRG